MERKKRRERRKERGGRGGGGGGKGKREGRREGRREEGGKAGQGAGSRAGLTLLAVEDSQEAEHEGPTGGSEEAPPVIPDREVGGHDLDAEQDAWGRH